MHGITQEFKIELLQHTIFCCPYSDYCTWRSFVHCDCRNCTIVCIVGMKGTNCGLGDASVRGEAKSSTCLKFSDINPVFTEITIVFIPWRVVPSQVDVRGVQSYSTDIGCSTTWICN